MEEEELEATGEKNPPGHEPTSSRAVRQKRGEASEKWIPGDSQTTPYRSSKGEKQKETPAPSHEIERERRAKKK